MNQTLAFPPGYQAIQPYNIAEVGENEAEINLYGVVVDERPRDWNGELMPGNYIAVDDFLRDLDALAAKETVTVHLNSLGGSLYAGLSIYNRLRALPGNVVTVIDGVAASAGSIIFQAGKVRRANAGSSLMVHGANALLCNYYSVKDLKNVIRDLDAGTRAAVNAYAEATGRDAESIRALLDKETWLTGQEIVDAGFADELTEGGAPASLELTEDRAYLVSNGVAFPALGFQLPGNLPVMQEIRRTKTVEIKDYDSLKAAYPQLLAQAEESARSAGRTEERARLQGIEEIEAALGDPALVRMAKYGEHPMSAEQAAFAAMKAQASLGAAVLNKLNQDAAASGAGQVSAAPAAEPGNEDNEETAVQMIVGHRARKGE